MDGCRCAWVICSHKKLVSLTWAHVCSVVQCTQVVASWKEGLGERHAQCRGVERRDTSEIQA